MSEHYLNQVKNCVTFLFANENPPIALGTGFFASVKTKYGDIVYLVTAKHVIQNSSGKFYNSILYRLNTINGSSRYIILNITEFILLTHPDKDVDLVAILQYPPQDEYDYLYIPQEYFTNNEILNEKNIREGAKVFFSGLFTNLYTNYSSEQKNYPILRFGTISFLPNEKIIFREIKTPKSAHLYIIECQSLGGFSGSPVFFEIDRITPKKLFFTPEIYLGGIMKGHYNDIIETQNGIIRELNAGLALVTPCYLLKEILDTDIAKKQIEDVAKFSKN